MVGVGPYFWWMVLAEERKSSYRRGSRPLGMANVWGDFGAGGQKLLKGGGPSNALVE